MDNTTPNSLSVPQGTVCLSRGDEDPRARDSNVWCSHVIFSRCLKTYVLGSLGRLLEVCTPRWLEKF